MIGPLLIAVSWLLLRFEGRGITELGFNKPVQRIVEFTAGFSLAAAFASAQYLLTAEFSEFTWVVNPELNASLVLESLRWNTNSVLFEELVFRGYLLYKAIELLGPRKACFLSAAAFGIYHWFSLGVLGNPAPMIYVFFFTGAFGLMLAYAFERSGSVVLPIALHLGWNLVTILVFSNGPLGPQVLMPSIPGPSTMQVGHQVFVVVFLPLTLPILVLWLVLKRVGRYAETAK